jgi:hypothetical protein
MEQTHDNNRTEEVLDRAGGYLMRRSSEYRELPMRVAMGQTRHSRKTRRGLVGVGATTAVAVTALVMGSGSGSPALAWSPTPSVATTVDEKEARTACAIDSWGVDRTPNLPEVLPTLTTMDVRGNGALAVFSDSKWTVSCMLRRDGDGFERGPIIAEELTNTGSDNALGISGIASTMWPDGKSTSMINGAVPTGAVSIELDIAGQPTAQASVSNGRFSIWWIGAYDESLTGEIRALDSSGVEVASVSLESVTSRAGR